MLSSVGLLVLVLLNFETPSMGYDIQPPRFYSPVFIPGIPQPRGKSLQLSSHLRPAPREFEENAYVSSKTDLSNIVLDEESNQKAAPSLLLVEDLEDGEPRHGAVSGTYTKSKPQEKPPEIRTPSTAWNGPAYGENFDSWGQPSRSSRRLWNV